MWKGKTTKPTKTKTVTSSASVLHTSSRGSMPLAQFSEKKWRHITAFSSLCQTIRNHRKKTFRSSGSKKRSRRHSTCSLLKRSQVCLKTNIYISLASLATQVIHTLYFGSHWYILYNHFLQDWAAAPCKSKKYLLEILQAASYFTTWHF